MADDSFAELAKLKSRLESLGVKIKGCPETAAAQVCHWHQAQALRVILPRSIAVPHSAAAATIVDKHHSSTSDHAAAVQRRKQRQSQDMATLLARCDHVESTVDRQQPSVAAAPQPCASPGPSSPVPTSRDQNPPECACNPCCIAAALRQRRVASLILHSTHVKGLPGTERMHATACFADR